MRYKKKPLEVEALQYTGDNSLDIVEFCNAIGGIVEGEYVLIKLTTSDIKLKKTDYIIKDNYNVYYPLGESVFNQLYEEIFIDDSIEDDTFM